MICAAKHPIIVTASVGRSRDGYEALIDFAEALALPVVESPSAQVNSFPKDHPLHQGFDIQPSLSDADLVLAVNSRTPWYPPNGGPVDARVVVVDDAPFKTHMAYQNLRADELLCGHVPSTLRLLAALLRARTTRDRALVREAQERHGRLARQHDALREERRATVTRAQGGVGIHPVALCVALSEVLPPDAVYVDDTTVHLPTNRRHLVHSGAQCYLAMRSGLGQGLGVALGVKLASPERVVVALLGDGAFLYNPTLPALGFARDVKLPILIVIYNNRGYRAMRDSQLLYYPAGLGAQHGQYDGEPINAFGYETLAEPLGGFGVRVESAEALMPALAQGYAAVREGRSAIVNVMLAH
jgi:acetolactate synthase-1/2/3 large subunit